MSKLTITGISLVVVGILVLIWGATVRPVNLASPEFMSFATGGLMLFAAGLCMIAGLPALFSVGGVWLAAVATMFYINSLPNTDFIIKLIGFVPVIAFAAWLSLKLWK